MRGNVAELSQHIMLVLEETTECAESGDLVGIDEACDELEKANALPF